MKQFQALLQAQFDQMMATGKLYRAAITGDEIWDLYLKSFTPENDPIFRDPSSTVHNCNHCNNFIRRYGNIVAIDSNNNLRSIFGVITSGEFANTAKVLDAAITSRGIATTFVETLNDLIELPYESCNKNTTRFQIGVASNPKRYTREEAEKYGTNAVKPNEIRIFDHIFLHLHEVFVDKSGKSTEAITGRELDNKMVFQRGMETISYDTLQLVIDLIKQGSLLNGDAHLDKVVSFARMKTAYDLLPTNLRDVWCWKVGPGYPLAKFRNELIGTLCVELSEGADLNAAVQNWNKRVDPVNYMKTTAPITKGQIKDAQTFVEENGYVESFNRRFATLKDIKVSEILHANAGDNTIKTVSIFDTVKASVPNRHKRNEFDGVETIPIEKFMTDILPGCTSIEAFLTAKQEGNMVSLTTANNPESKPIFKWANNYSWTFAGNLAGKSTIKDQVRDKGGNVSGVLRFSLLWNESGADNSDLDAWCKEASGYQIGYSTGYRADQGNQFSQCGGQLDLDNTTPRGKVALENIYFKAMDKLRDGQYIFWVNQYSARNSKGFKAEIEMDGESYFYEYNKPVYGNVRVAIVTLKNGVFSIEHDLSATSGEAKCIYGLQANQFHKVNLVCLSPNHWEENAVGNKHYMFMLKGCTPDKPLRTFHNENLLPQLADHRKVLEVLGATTMIEPAEGLSGLGFNATVRDEVILKLEGTHKRIVKVLF